MTFPRWTLVFCAGLAVGCAGVRDAATFADAVEARFHVPASVFINNGTHLRVTFRNAPAAVIADSTRRAAFAREVAVFAKHAYPHPETLADVTVAFAAVRSAGPVTLTQTDAPYRWTLAELP